MAAAGAAAKPRDRADPAPAGAGNVETGAGTGNAAGVPALLRRARERIGLGDAEQARIAAAAALAASGDAATARARLVELNAEFDRSMRLVAVADGENLRAFAGRDEVYGNAALWPLIWRANPKLLPEPWQVQRGAAYRVPVFPTLDAVTEAIAWAQAHPLDVVRPDARPKPAP